MAFSATAHAILPDSCRTHPGDFCTFTQGGWGQDECRGHNVGCIRNQNWATVFPGGSVTIGGTFTIRLTSAAAVAAYLPSGTTPGVLTQNYVDPTAPTTAGVFAAQVLTLKLNVAFGAARVGGMHDIGPLVISSGALAGHTVNQLLALANTVLGGNTGALPAGLTVSGLNDIVDGINNNYDGCSRDNGNLHLYCPECHAPTAVCYSGNPAVFTYGQAVTVSATVTDVDSDVASVSAHYVTSVCDVTVAATYSGGRWSVTIPSPCTRVCDSLRVTFTARDTCNLSSEPITCTLRSMSQPPEIACWTGNPVSFVWGQPLTMCATVSDADNNIALVSAQVLGCAGATPATFVSGRWCVTIPATCTRTCGPLAVVFTATDSCGYTDRDTCRVNSGNIPPVQACYSGNPTTFNWGQPLTMCVTVSDANLASVTAGVIGCTAPIPVSFTSGRWCATIPATCTQTCSPLAVVFTAIDSCGLIDRDTCRVNSDNIPPVQACYSGNPTTFIWGQPLTMCVTVSDANLASVTAGVIGCGAPIPVSFTSGRWCATIPATCTRTCSPLAVVFTAIDSCGLFDRDTCRVISNDIPPVQTCWPENPATYLWGQPLNMCVTVSDVNLASVTASIIGCGTPIPVSFTSGRWCATIPATCTRTCEQLAVVFTATDSCGYTDRDTCRVNSGNIPPAQACYSGNPTTFIWGQPLTMCVTVSDANLASVTAGVIGCGTPIPVSFTSGRWCATIPATCTRTCEQLAVVFTALDSCGYMDRDTCRVNSSNIPPVQACYTGNPTTFTWGAPLTMCVTVSDANLATVTAGVIGCAVPIPVTLTGGRWCATIPATCTRTCSPLAVVFTALDSCGLIDRDTCRLVPANPRLTVDCWPGNPPTYNWGQPLTICATVTAGVPLATVTAQFAIGSCNQTVAAVYGAGLWCATIPANCTRQCGDGYVIITATDSCGIVDRDTCRVTLNNTPPALACAPFNPQTYVVGQPLTLCAIVSDVNLQMVWATYQIGTCNVTVPTVRLDSVWCVTVPASCTQLCTPGQVIFTAIDSCGLSAVDTCRVTGRGLPPTIACAADNPLSYSAGENVTLCVDVADPDGNIASITGSYTTGLCLALNLPLTPTAIPGRWCLTVPDSCLNFDTLNVLFRVRDLCGDTARTACHVIPQEFINCPPSSIACWSGNPPDYQYNQPLTLCATENDPDNVLGPVIGHYETPLCTLSVPATWVDGRWCLTIPAACTRGYTPIRVIFTALDTCSNVRADTCEIPTAPCSPPVASCWTGNPQFYAYNTAFSLCVDVADPDNDISVISARIVSSGVCNGQALTVTMMEPPRWCALIPATCTQENQPLAVEFIAFDRCGQMDTVVCTVNPPPANECCFWCELDPGLVSTSQKLGGTKRAVLTATIFVDDGHLHISWSAVPAADYFLVFAGALEAGLDEQEVVAFAKAGETEWIDPTPLEDLPERQFYQVVAYRITAEAARLQSDRGRWEFNEGVGDTAHDYSGLNHDAWRWLLCPPNWGAEIDTACNDAYAEYMDFDGYDYTPDRCIEHLRAANDSIFYRDRFQIWARIRIHEHPTTDTGPFYIASNHSLALLVGGGYGFRIDPGWVDRNGVREYHNRLTGLVWDRTLNGGQGGFRSIQSASPTLTDTTTNSVPLNQWSCISMIVDGTNSMLLIDGRVVAAGNLRFRSDNNGVPLIIGAGYRHSTFPIEYPFIGEMDCLRITDLP